MLFNQTLHRHRNSQLLRIQIRIQIPVGRLQIRDDEARIRQQLPTIVDIGQFTLWCPQWKSRLNSIVDALFPAEVLPIVSVLANLVHFLLGLPILAALLVYYQRPLDPIELLWFPVIVLVQFLFTTGIALLLAALTVHFRDIKDILANLLTLWFFSTPIIYSMQMAPESYRWVLNLNPMTHLAISYQEVLFHVGPHGHWKWLLTIGATSTVVFLAGYFIFDRLRDSFAEEV